MTDSDIRTSLAVLTSEVAGLRLGVESGIATLNTRVDHHAQEIDRLRERQIRFDEREKVRREGVAEGTERTIAQWQVRAALGAGCLGLLGALVEALTSHL